MTLSKFVVTNHARTAQREVVEHLKGLGFTCRVEHKVSLRGKDATKSGRIDILATKNSKTLGIEVDRRNPRKKSIDKLNSNTFDYKIILCRGGNRSYKIDNIYILPLKIK